MASALKTYYLVSYNLVQWILWVSVVGLLIQGCLESGGDLGVGAVLAFPLVKLAVGVAWLEMVHSVLGMTKGSIVAAAGQMFGRSMTTFGILNKNPEVVPLDSTFLLFLTWALIELIRYPFYALTLINRCPKFLEYLRYSAFIPLYPVGMILEWIAVRTGLPYMKIRDYWSIYMPNTLNFEFSFYLYCSTGWIQYLLIGPWQYAYMLKQRSKRFAASKAQPTKTE
ncbi:hypothetical protein NDN08_003372 [Rhodosorus marinus]|uniref:very-long-chain (3R)-3-hydroxyacyl-CoA dehydratase n=1 Tax=Rhodosorus marinus TaxID=101924 RepID=A0AAV8UWB5_9RHOD|nr:hypothetical protein NDN08_003372 [Rhodosorus marinus]